jgi:hypothetical protein
MSTKRFLDDMKQGWGVKYGPTLQALGLDDLDDAQDLTEVDLKELLGGPLRAAGVPPLHVTQIVKRVHLINSKQSNTPSPSQPTHNPLYQFVTFLSCLPIFVTFVCLSDRDCVNLNRFVCVTNCRTLFSANHVFLESFNDAIFG